MEKRKLRNVAKLVKEDGTINTEVFDNFSGWIDDNIGLRTNAVAMNARIQFYGFERFANNSNLGLGSKGEISQIPEDELLEYQHLNLKTEEELEEIARAFQIISDYLKEQDIQYYYVQCYDKFSFYPEQMPLHINQYGDMSKTDQVAKVLKEKTDIQFIDLKDKLMEMKEEYQIFSRFGDPGHWTQRGGYLGYKAIMDEINRCNSERFLVLDEEDYEINLTDQGSDLFGGIHLEDFLEEFIIREKQAEPTSEKLGSPNISNPDGFFNNDVSAQFFTNETVDNRTRVLVLADSYFHMFILDDLSESFHEMVYVHADSTMDFPILIEYYQPDIVIHENAQRADRYDLIVEMAKLISTGS
ncbi:MAG: hypothetical protein IJP31_10635 [Lachnospiraceae bacterium]|nr:hypothetical protein [Lachnospiraceae bacterium]